MNPRLKLRRGVASLIGGVFLILIIISAYAFFTLSNKATNDLQTTINYQSSLDEVKNQENLVFNYVAQNPDHSGVILDVENLGSKPLTISYIGTQDLNGNYTFSEPLGNPNINPSEFSSYNIPIKGFVAGQNYPIKFITNKGSIFSFNYLEHERALSNLYPSISITPAINNTKKQLYLVSGSNFAPNSSIEIIISLKGTIIDNITTPPSGSGLFSSYLKLLPAGVYNLTATAVKDKPSTANDTLTVEPYINLIPSGTEHADLDTLTVLGTGYPPSSTIKVLLDSLQQTITQTDPSGSFTVSFNVKGKNVGSHIVEADCDPYQVSNIFTVLP